MRVRVYRLENEKSFLRLQKFNQKPHFGQNEAMNKNKIQEITHQNRRSRQPVAITQRKRNVRVRVSAPEDKPLVP